MAEIQNVFEIAIRLVIVFAIYWGYPLFKSLF